MERAEELVEEAERRLRHAALQPSGLGPARQSALEAVGASLREAESLLARDGGSQASLRQRASAARSQLAQLLYVSPTGPDERVRERLLQGSASLQRSSASVAESARTAATAQATGEDVLAALAAQREQLQRAKDTNAEVDASLAGSQDVLKRMGRWWNGLI